MDKATLLEHLALGKKHLAKAEGLVTRQRALVEQLARDGHDVSLASTLLEEYEYSLALYQEDVARVRAMLDALP